MAAQTVFTAIHEDGKVLLDIHAPYQACSVTLDLDEANTLIAALIKATRSAALLVGARADQEASQSAGAVTDGLAD